MIILGLILAVIGIVAGIGILLYLGVILVIIGLVLLLLGSYGGRPVGGRRHWF